MVPLVFQRFRFRVIPLVMGGILVVLGYFVVPYEMTSSADYVPTLAVTAEQMVQWEGVVGKVLFGSALMILGAILALAYSYFEVFHSVTNWGKPHKIRHLIGGCFAILVAVTAFEVGGPSLLWLAVGAVVVLMIFGSYHLLVGKGFN
ncbi:MAG: hypothetical protein GX262_10390 [Clostridia bacterium]|jgi:hypothetical protein|nr:hypothetical protein [Clostridia bacterium]